MKHLHSWNVSYTQARRLQQHLAPKIRQTPIASPPRTVAGLDCALGKDRTRIFAAVAVLRLPELQLVETANAAQNVTFPYIPGLLSFREAPVCIAAVEKLTKQPDVFIIDGQGIAHPRRLGLAAHLGLFFQKPTIGCAKSRLIGEFQEPPPEKGAFTPLTHRKTARTTPETIGAVLRTRTNVKPVFVSVGNKCTLEDAVRITLACTTRYRLPEPTRLAHRLVGQAKDAG